MKWEQIAQHQKIYFQLYVSDDEYINCGLKEFWVKLLNDVLPRNSKVDWDFVRIEIWPDTGRIISFPSNSEINDRVELAGCQVKFENLQKFCELLDNSDITDEAYDERLNQELSHYAHRLICALEPDDIKLIRADNNTTLKIDVRIFNSDSTIPFCEHKFQENNL